MSRAFRLRCRPAHRSFARPTLPLPLAWPRSSDEYGGYRRLIGTTFADLIAAPGGEGAASAAEEIPGGVLATVYDKNKQEASG